MAADTNSKWSRTAWESAQTVYKELIRHPFVIGMMDGTLPRDKFVNYLQQDMIYLSNYGKEMNLLSQLMPTVEMRQLFERLAAEGVETEEALHELLAKEWQVEPTTAVSEATVGYMQFTRHYLESGNAALAIAALLPCFWVYNELGHYMASCCPSDDHPYKAWIDTYESPEMDEVVAQVIAIADAIAVTCSEEQQETMRELFVEATRWEMRFFEQ